MSGLKVGITVVGDRMNAKAELWSNGIGQNIAYLALLMQRLPIVDQIVLVACPAGERHALGETFGLPVIHLDAAVESMDVIIELGARGAEPRHAERLRARGGKLVSYAAGNFVVMNMEELAVGAPHGDRAFESSFDAVWLTPQHWHTCHAYSALVRSPRVELAPHIWMPICVNQSMFDEGVNAFWRPPASDGWRIGVFDPSVNVVKTFHLPLLVAEEAHRSRPGLIKSVSLFNAHRLRDNVHTKEFIHATELGRMGKVSVEKRHTVTRMLGREVDAVITHQWENALNYLYWDVLYLGWPLVHNSQEIADVGYYYPAFNTQAGGKALIDGLEAHLRNPMHQRASIRDTLWKFSIDNPSVQSTYADLLESVMN